VACRLLAVQGHHHPADVARAVRRQEYGEIGHLVRLGRAAERHKHDDQRICWSTRLLLKPGVAILPTRRPAATIESKLFQRLTEHFGHPKLREHLTGAIMLMKYVPDWQTFMDRLDLGWH